MKSVKKHKNTSDIYIVGDRFIEFSNNEMIFTVSQFFEFAESVFQQKSVQHYILHAGQGLTEDADRRIIEFIAKYDFNYQFICSHSLFPAARAKASLTHKHNDKNTVVAEPTKTVDNCYESYLLIDENCAEISDHITGQHIQGSVLLEAARQMSIAVTEKYFIDDKNRDKLSFIANAVETKFYAYAFPLEIKIKYELKKERGLFKKNRCYKAAISFIQNDKVVTKVNYDFSVMKKTYVLYKEEKAAKSVVANAIRQGGWDETESVYA